MFAKTIRKPSIPTLNPAEFSGPRVTPSKSRSGKKQKKPVKMDQSLLDDDIEDYLLNNKDVLDHINCKRDSQDKSRKRDKHRRSSSLDSFRDRSRSRSRNRHGYSTPYNRDIKQSPSDCHARSYSRSSVVGSDT